jgi:hypothetical protein
VTEGDPESREAALVRSCARSALNDHTTTLTSSSWRLRAEKPPWRPPSCFVPDFDGAFLSSDSKDVRLLPTKTLCARCAQAIEFGG